MKYKNFNYHVRYAGKVPIYETVRGKIIQGLSWGEFKENIDRHIKENKNQKSTSKKSTSKKSTSKKLKITTPECKSAILKWFTGKPRERAEAALDMLAASEREGFWIPDASRKVYATLSKSNVVNKWMGNPYEDPFCNASVLKQMVVPSKLEGTDAYMALALGSFSFPYLRELKLQNLKKLVKTPKQREVFEFVKSYHRDFIKIAKLMRDLDNTRPKPVFTSLGVSPTITKTLKDAALDLNIKTVRICPTKTIWKKLKTKRTPVLMLQWPKRTKHDKSRFSTYDHQCQACGHSIYNPGNWVPVLIDNKAGVPHSLWVGRDCANRVFGVKVSGECTWDGKHKKLPTVKKTKIKK